jgi:hypothetical protein
VTVSAQTTYNAYTANGVTTVFPYQFKILAAGDIDVYVAGVLKTLNLDYTVIGVGADVGGSVIFTVAPAAASAVSLIRTMTVQRTTDYQQLGDFLTPVVNPDFDNAILLIQDVQTQLGRSIRMPADEVGTLPTLPSITNRANKFVAFDLNGLPIASAGTGGGDAALRTDLASTVSGSTGAQLVGQRRTATAVARSVALALATVNGVNLADFVTDFTGATDQSTQIQAAITFASSAISTGGGIFHPGGIIRHDSQITVPASFMVRGFNRVLCEFKFMGSPATAPAKTRSAWRYEAGTVNTSRFSNVHFEHVKINYANSINFSAALELNAGGGSYFSIVNCWLTGFSSYGFIGDAVELCFLHDNLIDNVSGITTGANILITNGANRSAGQGLGWSNIITISDNQLAGGGAAAAGGTGAYGIIDEGGNGLTVTGNNFDGHRFAASFAGRSGLTLQGKSFESPLLTGSANVQFGNLDVAGLNVGPCEGFEIKGATFFGAMSAGSMLTFTCTPLTVTSITKAASAVITVNSGAAANPFFIGCPITLQGVVGMTQINQQSAHVSAIGGVSGAWTATIPLDSTTFSNYVSGGQVAFFHTGGTVESCTFGSVFGRGGAIDVTYLANGRCWGNHDFGNSSMTHYVGVHNDALGNDLDMPQNGFPGTVGINGRTYGCNRGRTTFFNAVQFDTPFAPTYSASINWDLKESNFFEVTPTNGVAFTINNPANAAGGNWYRIWIINTTGGALGAVTFGASMRLGGAWVNPATGNRRFIEFEVDGAGISHECGRSPADVPN